MKKIDLCLEPRDFFRERITSALSHQKIKTTEIAEYYLVELMTRFMVSENLQTDSLAIMLLKAQSSEIDEPGKVKILKKLGDTSLYISGFFADSLNRRVIDLDYYRNMGAIAYRTLSGTIREDTFQSLYNELYTKFLEFTHVLTEISQDLLTQDNQNLLRLYELYVRTGSELARAQLNEKGLPTTIVPGNSKDKQ